MRQYLEEKSPISADRIANTAALFDNKDLSRSFKNLSKVEPSTDRNKKGRAIDAYLSTGAAAAPLAYAASKSKVFSNSIKNAKDEINNSFSKGTLENYIKLKDNFSRLMYTPIDYLKNNRAGPLGLSGVAAATALALRPTSASRRIARKSLYSGAAGGLAGSAFGPSAGLLGLAAGSALGGTIGFAEEVRKKGE